MWAYFCTNTKELRVLKALDYFFPQIRRLLLLLRRRVVVGGTVGVAGHLK